MGANNAGDERCNSTRWEKALAMRFREEAEIAVLHQRRLWHASGEEPAQSQEIASRW